MPTPMPTPDPAVAQLLAALDEGYDHPGWHGPTLQDALRGVTPTEADRRPAPGRHSIREIALHAAYWKAKVRQRLAGEPRAEFPLEGDDWFTPAPGRTWRDDLDLLAGEHRRLRETVAAFPPGALERIVDGKDQTAAYNIRGIAAHDVYHAGQIQLVRTMI
jgi:hypothetical protein